MIPWHPLVVHLPLALSIFLPPLVLVFALLIHQKKLAPESWYIILGLQILLTASGYLALETGETDEQITKTILESRFVNAHEEAAEIFVGTTVLSLVLAVVAVFIQSHFQTGLRIAVFLIGLISCYLAYDTGVKGGELVYVHGAAEAYHRHELDETEAPGEGILPTPGIETSESSVEEVNESLKVDETEYGDAEDVEIEEDSSGE